MIRPFTPSDTDALVAIFKLNVPQYFAPNEQAEFEDYLQRFGETYLIIEEDGEIIGGMGYQFTQNDTIGSITWIFFHPNRRGQGLGRQAAEHCLNILTAKPTLTKIVVRTSQLVYGFFEKLDFRVTHTEKDYWAEGFDLYVMELNI